MEIDALKAIDENVIPNLMLILEIAALIAGIFALVGLVIYLCGIAALCFEVLPQSSGRGGKASLNPPETGQVHWLPGAASTGNKANGKLSGSLPRREWRAGGSA